ncbi:MAG: dihydrofolate reductase [Candidatus Paceibacterota bacterium]
MISLVVAVSLNGVIGKEGRMPWRLPSDLKNFKVLTLGSTVIMGRKTFESLPPKFRPLPGRTNIVLSRSPQWQPDGQVTVCRSWFEVEKIQDEGVFVIGGQSVYEIAFPVAEVIHRTVVQVECTGDSFFPELPLADWELIDKSSLLKNDGDQYPFVFETWHRR